MRKEMLALACLCFAVPAMAGVPSGQDRVRDGQGVICADCEPDDGGGGGSGGGTTPPPPPKMTLSHTNSTENTLELTLSDGLVVVVDRDLNKMFVGHGSKQAEFPLVETLTQWAKGDQALVAATLAKIDARLNDANGSTKFQAATTSSLSSFSSGFGISPKGNKSGPESIMYDGGMSNYNCYQIYGCQRINTMWDGGWGGYGFSFFDGGGGYPTGGTDWWYWDRWRRDQCDDMHSSMSGSGLAAAGVAVGCGTAYTGIGAVVCGVALVALVVEMNSVADSASQCYSQYPGSGNW